MILFLLNICAIIVAYLLLRISKKISLLFIVATTITTLVYSHAFDNYSIRSTEIHNQIIYSIDRCASYVSVLSCRIIYNKPLSIASVLFVEFISHFTSENILSFVRYQYRSIATLFCYIGIICVLVKTKKHDIELILIVQLVSYGVIGSFATNKSILSLADSATLILFTLIGLYSLVQHFYNYALKNK